MVRSRGDFNMSMRDSIELASEIVAAYVSNNPLPKGELPPLLQALHAALGQLAAAPKNPPSEAEVRIPAVPIRKSISAEFLICLEDGRQFKSLRRHLTGLSLTPHYYREKWNLASDCPMVAPNYAARRSALAKEIGLGQKRPGADGRKRAGRAKADKA